MTDAFGQDWKLKWGDEAVIEPIGNRLRVLLGAKFCDLTYTSTEGDSHLLILGLGSQIQCQGHRVDNAVINADFDEAATFVLLLTGEHLPGGVIGKPDFQIFIQNKNGLRKFMKQGFEEPPSGPFQITFQNCFVV